MNENKLQTGGEEIDRHCDQGKQQTADEIVSRLMNEDHKWRKG